MCNILDILIRVSYAVIICSTCELLELHYNVISIAASIDIKNEPKLGLKAFIHIKNATSHFSIPFDHALFLLV